MTTPSLPAPDWAATEQLLRTLCTPDQVVELRALRVASNNRRPHTRSGFYDYAHLNDLVVAAGQLTPYAQGVYISLNPLNRALLARRMNRVDYAANGDCAKDTDVVARRWFLVDIDPLRPSGISATDAEKEQAHTTTTNVLAFLTDRGWPAPVVCDSGNGFHLLYRIDLPITDDRLVERVLQTLAQRFDTTHAKIDTAVGNACRLCKLPGTLARKGDSTPDRPHRRCVLLQQPPTLSIVTHEQLLSLARPTSPPPAAPPATPLNPRPEQPARRGPLDVGRWLSDNGYHYRVKDQPDARGRTVYCLEHCPFNPAHTNQDAAIFLGVDGKLGAKCLHQSCQGLGWKAFKSRIGKPRPEHYSAHPTAANQVTNAVPPQTPVTESDTVVATLEVIIDPANRTTETVVQAITDLFKQQPDCFQRAGQFVVCSDQRPQPIITNEALIARVHERAEVIHISAVGRRYHRPLTSNYASMWLHQAKQRQQLPELQLFTANPVFTPHWKLTPSGYDPVSGIYYAGPTIAPRHGTTHLDALLAGFCFATPSDRTNYLAMLLTMVLMPHFIGAKPALILNANQPGLGKTMLAQILAILRDGRTTTTITYCPDDTEFEKRLGAVVYDGATVIIIDNVRNRGRQAKIDSPCLERSITDRTLSFRLLGASTSIRAENSHLFCLTANEANLTPDLISRSVLVHLAYDGNPAERVFVIPDPERYAVEHRHAILSELLGMVQGWLEQGRPLADAPSRFNQHAWGPIIGGILAWAKQPSFLGNAPEARVVLDRTRHEFQRLLDCLRSSTKQLWSAEELVTIALQQQLLVDELGVRPGKPQHTIMGQIASRFKDQSWTLSDGEVVGWEKVNERNRCLYRIVPS